MSFDEAGVSYAQLLSDIQQNSGAVTADKPYLGIIRIEIFLRPGDNFAGFHSCLLSCP